MGWNDELLIAADPDQTYQRHLQHSIDVLDDPAAPRQGAAWRPVVVSYCGNGNLGADLRAAETIRHVRHLVPGCRPRMTVLGRAIPFAQFDNTEQLAIDSYLPTFVKDRLVNADAVIVAEGSLFTSTFSDDLAMFFVAALAQRRRNGKPAIAFGIETDAMSARLLTFVQEHSGGCSIFCRNRDSVASMQAHGLPAMLGADPAWAYGAPGADSRALREARQTYGSDGAYVVICPVNPFWWPVRLDRQKLEVFSATGRYRDTQFNGAYFHCFDDSQRQRYEHYVQQYAAYIDWCRQRLNKVPVLLAMDGVDSVICADINERVAIQTKVVPARASTPESIAALLGGADFVVSNRFHAAILALLGRVPCIAVSMDGRLEALYRDMGLDDLLLRTDSIALCAELQELSTRLLEKGAAVRQTILLGHALQLRRLGEMGRALVQAVQASASHVRTLDAGLPWARYLPPLSPAMQALLAETSAEYCG
jgi:polysaccharide pyruvyl transferase WcaK-like protein